MNRRLKILVVHPWMGRGGSEATAMWTLAALQQDHEVTFVTSSPEEWDDLNAAYGTRVDPDRVAFRRAPRLPLVDGPGKLVHAQLRLFERFCQDIAGEFDLCVSAYNPIYFRRPGIQLIGDFSFSESMRKRLYIHGEEKFRHRDSFFRRAYLGLGKLIQKEEVPLRERGDLILANSTWSAQQLEEHFGVPDSKVVYPPVVLPSLEEDLRTKGSRDPLGFVCLGRVVPEKELGRVIEILERLREEGEDVSLRLIGSLDDSPYSQKIGALIEKKDWIIPEGFLELEEKQQILATHTFALHACRIEAFGIAVAEMASMGCVPIVPDSGGAGEIVPFPELQFASVDEAVTKIRALIHAPGRVAELSTHLQNSVDRFGPDVFMRELREHVLDFAGLASPHDVDPSKNQPACF